MIYRQHHEPASAGSRRRLFRSERGAAVIELALVAPILGLLVIGVVDMSNAFSRKLQAEQAAQRAIEKIQQTTQDKTVEDAIKDEAVCQVNGTNSDGTCKTTPLTESDVSVTYTEECTDSAGTVTTFYGSDAADCGSGATQTQYISVTVNDKYTPLFPIHFLDFNSDGTYHISATAGMRTE